jgi:hypothetical protein
LLVDVACAIERVNSVNNIDTGYVNPEPGIVAVV